MKKLHPQRTVGTVLGEMHMRDIKTIHRSPGVGAEDLEAQRPSRPLRDGHLVSVKQRLGTNKQSRKVKVRQRVQGD